MSKLPHISNKHKICVICEGLEELIYFNRLISLNVWDQSYEFTPVNAKGESNIFARFQDAYNNDSYEMIIIFCDTDKKTYREYRLLKEKLNDYFDSEAASQNIILWANPCSMQIILFHFDVVSLTNQGKKTNAGIIEELTGVQNYNGHEKQINEICNQIYWRTYPEMKERLVREVYCDEESGSTNIVSFLKSFEDNDDSWIKMINCLLEG